jgi:hypothetical protein
MVAGELRVRSPRRREQQLHLLGHDQRSEFSGEVHEVGVGEQRFPERAAIGIVVEFP